MAMAGWLAAHVRTMGRVEVIAAHHYQLLMAMMDGCCLVVSPDATSRT
jgi:hypothetical protein